MYVAIKTKSGDTIWYQTNTPYFLRSNIARIEFEKYLNRKDKKSKIG